MMRLERVFINSRCPLYAQYRTENRTSIDVGFGPKADQAGPWRALIIAVTPRYDARLTQTRGRASHHAPIELLRHCTRVAKSLFRSSSSPRYYGESCSAPR